MKIAVLTAARCGSRWLFSLFNNPNNINLWEWFNPHHHPIFEDFTIEKCVAGLQESIHEADTSNKDLYVKIIPNEYRNRAKTINDFLNEADLLIRLTRTDRLRRYISLEKARKTNAWYKHQKPINKDTVKIVWDFEKYQIFYHRCNYNDHWIQNHYHHKPSVSFTYEQIHSFPDELSKLNFVKESIRNLGFCLHFNENIHTFAKQESSIRNLSDHFVNPRDFLRCFNQLKLY